MSVATVMIEDAFMLASNCKWIECTLISKSVMATGVMGNIQRVVSEEENHPGIQDSGQRDSNSSLTTQTPAHAMHLPFLLCGLSPDGSHDQANLKHIPSMALEVCDARSREKE